MTDQPAVLRSAADSDLGAEAHVRAALAADAKSALKAVALDEVTRSKPYSVNDFLAAVKQGAAAPGQSNVIGRGPLSGVTTTQLYEEMRTRARAFRRQLLDSQRPAPSLSLFAAYGDDSRTEIKDTNDYHARIISMDTVFITLSSSLTRNDDDSYTLRTAPLATVFTPPLCPGERFRDQPCALGIQASGMFVGHDLVATAGHVGRIVDDVTQLRFITGFEVLDDGTTRTHFSPTSVWNGERLVDYRLDGAQDWALIRVTGPANRRQYGPVRHGGRVRDRGALAVIGHPTGLPLKVATGFVTDNSSEHFFVTDLDTFGGNSGSIVIGYEPGRAWSEGLLVRGQPDYVEVDGCTKVNFCTPTTCAGGEDVQRWSDCVNVIDRYNGR